MTGSEQKAAAQLELKKQEYVALFSLLLKIEDRLLQVFTGTVAVVVALLSAICGSLIKSGHLTLHVADAYIALSPLLIIYPSFMLVADLRHDLVRTQAYITVFFEAEDVGPSWGLGLLTYQEPSFVNSLDTIPLTYAGLYVACIAAFFYLLFEAVGAVAPHFLICLVTAAALVPPTKKWKDALGRFSSDVGRWQDVRDRLPSQRQNLLGNAGME